MRGCLDQCLVVQLCFNALTCANWSACRFLPYLGMVTIFMNDYPWLKYALIGTLGLFVLTSKE